MILILLRDLIFAACLGVIFFDDLSRMVIPRRIVLPMILFAFLLNSLAGFVSIWSMVLGAWALGSFFWIQRAVSKGKWIGAGDVGMGVLVGTMLGFLNGLLALFLAYSVGAIVCSVLLLIGKIKRGDKVPFGAFLSIGALVALVFGHEIINWYLGFFA
jgi:prepilin signal peptidase PulO-like enzyme (type II secretory pathway)